MLIQPRRLGICIMYDRHGGGYPERTPAVHILAMTSDRDRNSRHPWPWMAGSSTGWPRTPQLFPNPSPVTSPRHNQGMNIPQLYPRSSPTRIHSRPSKAPRSPASPPASAASQQCPAPSLARTRAERLPPGEYGWWWMVG